MATANLASDPLAASNILQNSLIRFQSILSKDQQAEIERTSFQDVEIAVRQIQAQQLATKTYNNLNKIRPFINSMQKVIELNQFLNASAISAYVWVC